MSISDATVDMVVSMLAPDFDKVYVMDHMLRRTLVRQMLEEEDFVGEALGKYDLMELLSDQGQCNDVMAVEKPRSVTLTLDLSGEERLLLQKNNRDVSLLFEPGMKMPHSYYYAQRIVDTDRCLRGLSHYGGEIIDIGGNYAAHARQCRIVHSCTLLNSAREAHRQTERLVRMAAEKRCLDSLDYCTVGAQVCKRQATQSMSVHAITDIPWHDWPEIMDRHGLSYHIAVFHYDPIMLNEPHGVLEGGYMYYDVRGDKVNFHFESDSSMDYTHEWSNFKKYTAPWCQYSKRTEWAYLYDLKTVCGGVATAEIVRVPKSDLGIQVPKPSFAYVPMEDKISVSTWMYDMESGLPVDDPVAFARVDMMVDREMYQYMYMFGLSNDTATPNRPMSLDEFRALGRVYNQTRRFGDTCITGKRKLNSLTAYTVYDGIYHVVCRERALLASRAASITSAMMLNQKVASQSMAYIAMMLPPCAVGAAFVSVGECFNYYFKRFSEMWRRCLAGELKIATTAEVSSYIPLESHGYSDTDGFHQDNNVLFFDRPFDSNIVQPMRDDVEVSVEDQIADLETPSETSEDSSFLEEDAITEDVSDTLLASSSKLVESKPLKFHRRSEENLLTIDQIRDIEHDGSSSVVTDEIINSDYRVDQPKLVAEYKQHVASELPITFKTDITTDLSELHMWSQRAMTEFAVYCFDVGRGVVSEMALQAKQIFVGTGFDHRRVENLNAGQDVGVKTFEVFNGKLPREGVGYAMGMDPRTGRAHMIRTAKNGSLYIDDASVSHLFVTSATRVFNSFAIARGVLKSIENQYEPRYTLSLVDGVPGCGKTAEIISQYTVNDVVLCAVRDSKDDTLMRLMQLEKFEDYVGELKLRVRTLDSVIMHGFRAAGPVDVVFLDEGLMAFPGQMYAALERLRPRAVKVYGDRHQIKAIDRSPTLGSLLHKGVDKWTAVEHRDISYSMPADVCVLLSKHIYKRPIYTYSPVQRSVSVVLHKSPTDEVFVNGNVRYEYMSVLTADKAKLLTGLNFVDGKKLQRNAVEKGVGHVDGVASVSRVFTVHEAQGQRLNNTRVVRLNPNTAAVLSSVEHVVVAMSRHYLTCEYHTLARDDLLFRILSDVVLDEEMAIVMKESPPGVVDRIRKLKDGNL